MDVPSIAIVSTPGDTTMTERTYNRRIRPESKGVEILAKEMEATVDVVDSDDSEDLEVFESLENDRYKEKLTNGKLRRLGTHSRMWRNWFGRFAVMIAFLTSYDCLMKFSATLDQYGLTFVALFSVLMALIGFPLVYVEVALGQYTSLNAFSIFGRMAPGMSGVGILCLLHNLWYILTTQISFNFFFSVFMESINVFSSDLPWYSCSHSTNTAECRYLHGRRNPCPEGSNTVPLGDLCVSKSSVFAPPDTTPSGLDEAVANFDYDPMMQFAFTGYDQKSMELNWYPQFSVLVSLIVTSFMVFLFLRKGHKSTVLLSQICIYAFIFSGVLFVFTFLLLATPQYPNISGLQKTTPFSMALFAETVFLVLRVLKLGQGGLVYLGSNNEVHTGFIKDAAFTTIAITATYLFYSMFHLLVIDSALLLLSKGDVKALDRFDADNGYTVKANERIDSGSVRYNTAMFIMSMKQIGPYEGVITLFFSFLAVIQTATNMIIRYEIMLAAIVERWPRLDNHVSRQFSLHCLVLAATILNFLFLSPRSFFISVDIENVAFPILASITVLLQLFIVFFCYGPTRVYANIAFMVSEKMEEGRKSSYYVTRGINAMLIFLWCVLIPISILVSLVFSYQVIPFAKVFEHKTQLYLTLCIVLSLAVVPIVLVKKAVAKYRTNSPYGELFKVEIGLWGPRVTRERERAENMEKVIRSFW